MISRPRGTRDFLPEEMAKRREIQQTLMRTALHYGYREISTPVFEHAELFTMKSGDEIVDQMYIFKDKSDRDLALRPELTAATMRMYIAEMERAPQPVKVAYFGNAFRYERPQKGRYREFWQFGIELIGADSPEAEAEVITVAVMGLMNSGLKNYVLRLGHLGILRGIFEEANMPLSAQANIRRLMDKGDSDELFIQLDSIDGLSSEQRELIRGIIGTKLSVKEIMTYEPPFSEIRTSMASWEQLKSVIRSMIAFKVPEEVISVDLNIARGLDYYSGTVFEIDVLELGAEKQVCGGGAYSLLSQFGGKNAHQIGFAIGFDRLLLALEAQAREFELPGPAAYVIPVGEEALEKAMEITGKLRAEGIYTELELKRRGPSKCLKYASTLGARKALIIGGDELQEGSVTVKDLKTGDQKKVEMDKIVDFIKQNGGS